MLSELIERCKGPVYIAVNEHRNHYNSIEQYFDTCGYYLDPEVLPEMVQRDSVVVIQFYSSTTCKTVTHWDFDTAVSLAIETLRESNETTVGSNSDAVTLQ